MCMTILMLKRKYFKAMAVVVICAALAFVTWILYLTFLPHQQDVILKSYKPMVLMGNMAPLYTLKSLTAQLHADCTQWKVFGPHWTKTDGGWPVCMAEPFVPRKPCTVYSFGIRNDWAFDDAYRETYGCTLRTFDPSMGKTAEHEHKPGVFFYPMGLSDRREVNPRGWNMDSYRGFLTRFGDQDKIIPYLKFDVEVSEWRVLENMLSDGSLKNVMQLAFELHVPRTGNTGDYIRLIQGLEAQGFRRWFCRHHVIKRRNPRFLFQSDQVYININFLSAGQHYMHSLRQWLMLSNNGEVD